jgi:DNA ligase-1
MDTEPLFKRTKTGKLQFWKVWTEGGTIYTEYGLLDGKKQCTSKQIKGKNIGKANETSPAEQAEREAQSMHSHRLDKGYKLDPKEAEEKTVFLPMLAHGFDKAKRKLEYPVHVQPKLDGVRCLARKKGRGIELISKGGKPYSVPHIEKALVSLLPSGFVFDGELYIHGETLQTVNRLVKKHREGPEGSIRLDYHIYDGFYKKKTHQPWVERATQLQQLLQQDKSDKIRLVDLKVACSEEDVLTALEEFIQAGYEGAIVRTLEGPYLLAHRSRDLLKVKKFFDQEYEIVGHYYGTGRAAKAVVWVCKQEEGLEFGVVPMGTMEQREEWGANAEKYYGKQLKVKFWNKTEDNKPQFPIGICIRLEEDM